jgi:hypothetical protein
MKSDLDFQRGLSGSAGTRFDGMWIGGVFLVGLACLTKPASIDPGWDVVLPES